VADDGPGAGRRVGTREVLVVAAIAVAIVLGLELLTYVLPAEAQRVILESPLLIVVLVVGTAWLLWWVSRRRPPEV
jgi:hypothetical protein